MTKSSSHSTNTDLFSINRIDTDRNTWTV